MIHHSRALTKAEMEYGKIEGESLAVLVGVKMKSTYLYGIKFEVVTDHFPSYLFTTTPQGQLLSGLRAEVQVFRSGYPVFVESSRV